MQQIKNAIPNLLTLGNSACGLVVIILLLVPPDGQLHIGLIAILLAVAMACDFFDGFVARALKTTSELGKQLDSLSDLVTFGVVPGIMAFMMIRDGLHDTQLILQYAAGNGSPSGMNSEDWLVTIMPWWWVVLPFTGLLIPIFSAYRLAKFNIDTRQSYGFIGLPTPANALFFYGLFFSYALDGHLAPVYIRWVLNAYHLPFFVLAFSILLITEIPLLAMKFKDYTWKGNWPRYVLILISVTLLAILWYRAIPLIIVLYFILSFIDTRIHKKV